MQSGDEDERKKNRKKGEDGLKRTLRLLLVARTCPGSDSAMQRCACARRRMAVKREE